MEFKQWTENRYRHPVVLVFASPTAEQACGRNGMDLIQMLRPFSVHPTELFAHLGDRADTVLVRNFGVRLTRLQCVREVDAVHCARHLRHVLRDHAAMELAYGEQLDRAMSCLLKENGGIVAGPRPAAQVASQLLERSHPAWHSQFIRDYACLVRCSHFDTLDHPLGCIYAASTREAGGVEGIMREFKEQQKQPAETRRGMPCMDDDLHSYFLLLHDMTEGPSLEEARRMFVAVQVQYGHAHCALVKINSVANPQDVKSIDPSLWVEANVPAVDVPSRQAVHAAQRQATDTHFSGGGSTEGSRGGSALSATVGSLSPAEGSSNSASGHANTAAPASLQFPRVATRFGSWSDGMAKVTGCYLSPENVEELRQVMAYYLSRSLFNFVERKLRVLVLAINEKRVTTFGKVAAWFRNKDEAKVKRETWVASREGGPTMYLAGSLEMQMRRAADLLLALADYDSAISYYRMCRSEALATVSSREFNRPLIAACQEGIGVCDLLLGRLPLPSTAPWAVGGTTSKGGVDCRLEVAQNDYAACQVHTYALRLSLMLYEYCRTRSPPAVDRAAAALLHVQRAGTGSKNKLYSAVLHELLAAVLLFRNPPLPAGMSVPALLPNSFPLRSHVRQYARHMIIAGSAHLENNLLESSLRCYLRALRVCGGAGRRGNWQLIFEHLHTLLAHIYRKLGNQIRSIVMASIAVSMGTPMYSNPHTGPHNFDAFWGRQRRVLGNLGYTLCPHMVAPCVLPESIRVSTNALRAAEATALESQAVSDELAELEWQKMEEKLRRHYTGCASAPPRHRLNSRDEPGGMRRYSMHLTEPLEITFTLRNPIGGPLTAEKLCLLYVAKQKPDQLWKSAAAQTVELPAAASKSVSLSFSPSEEGTYVIIGLCWTLMELEGYYYFATQTHKAEGGGGAFEYAIEHPVPDVAAAANIEVAVAPPQAWITARLDPELPPLLRDGEYYQTTLVLTNESSYRTARNIALQRSPRNAHVAWMDGFSLERNLDAEATLALEEELAPKAIVTLPLTVQAHHSRDSSARCKNNIFFLVGYTSGSQKEEGVLSPGASVTSTFVASRFHRFFRRFVVKSAILLSSMVLPPANATLATAALITASNVSEARDPPLRVSRVMVVHRPRWRVAPTSLGSLLADNALDCILSPGAALCVPLSVVSETPAATSADGAAAMVEEVCIPLSSALPGAARRTAVEANIGAGVVDSAVNVYFMRCSFRGPGTIGEVNVPEALPFYLDKAGVSTTSAGTNEAAAPQENPYHPHPQRQQHQHSLVSVVEPFTPICVAVVWAVEEQGHMHSGHVFHFFDPVHCLSSCESSVAEAHERLQEHLCESMIENRTLHARHGALFYHVAVPYTVESTADSPDAVMIPVTVHCRSLAAHPLLVTVKTTTPGSLASVPSSTSSPVPVVFVGKTSAGFLLLPHENYSLKFTACAFAPGVADCNLFEVSAVALRLPPVGDRGAWQTGTSRSALMTLLGGTTACLVGAPEPCIAAGLGGGGCGGSNCSGGGTAHLGGVGALVCESIRIVVLGHGIAAIARVLFLSSSSAAMQAAAARVQPFQEEAELYERQCKALEQWRALHEASAGTQVQKEDALLSLYPPRAHDLAEKLQKRPLPTGQSDTPLSQPHCGSAGGTGSTGAAALGYVAASPTSSDGAVDVASRVEQQDSQQGLRDVTLSRGESSELETDTSDSSTTSGDEPA
ncbi:uncharacterized protein Tco025E_02419 [Trypanosoma conorhini]|uniref:ER-Golgi trafficking TRAPP I complex 85 kDa subunit family protein n=1 Tax=Trypanosoma conorhini TaxID=83891 RepID=A0A422Q4L5_9TRYP|nr:uncharacterized protein Tco025E_02419 [Trypanosoma conorhini]RNF24904.1 hypothetical protein Tco025E_02419 [Trypanosoma conorhini]